MELTKITKDQLKELGKDKLDALLEKIRQALWELKNEKVIDDFNDNKAEILKEEEL